MSLMVYAHSKAMGLSKYWSSNLFNKTSKFIKGLIYHENEFRVKS
jgi:hypothetical protein